MSEEDGCHSVRKMALIPQYNVQLVGIVGVSMRMEGRSQVLEEEVGRTVSKLVNIISETIITAVE